jgi:DNA-binding transcriptional MerR regulator
MFISLGIITNRNQCERGFTMEDLERIMNQLGLDTSLTLEEIPKIDLYMDQVIQLFENKFGESKRNEDEKVLTKTMINNYAKGKLIFPIHNKKYSKDHLILMSLIYQLKGALSINDIKVTLEGINKRIMKDEISLDSLYTSYLNLTGQNVEDFYSDLEERMQEVNEAVSGIQEEPSAYLEQVLMITSLVHMSNLYRRVAEKLVDGIVIDKEGKRQR